MTAGRILLRGGTVLTLGAKTPNHPKADVLVEDGRIAEIGTGLRVRDAESVDCTDSIVMPGLVDAHRHLWKTLLRNAGVGRAHGKAVPAMAFARHYTPEDLYAATLLGLLTAVEAGITTVVDWADLSVETEYTDAALQAHADAEVRTVYVVGERDGAGRGGVGAATLRRLATQGGTAVAGSLTTIAAGPPDADGPEPESAIQGVATAREAGVRSHIHAAVSTDGRGAIAGLGQRDALGPDVTLVHCAGADDADLAAIAAAGAAVALTPSTEMAQGMGFPPLQALIDHGIRPGLGVDDEIVAPGDVFAQMRAVQSLQHATLFDRKLAGKAGVPNLLSTREVIRYATFHGAHAAGLAQVTGSLEPGKQADILVLRTDRPNVWPVNDPIGAVVWGLDASNVNHVLVAGRARVVDGQLQADAGRVRRLALAARDRLARACGDVVPTGGPR
jgi:5-methylthioadenosine/S-adenosylhomocysteine deaminase